MRDIVERALNVAQLQGAEYADARLVSIDEESIRTRNGVVRAVQRSQTTGIGVRVLVDRVGRSNGSGHRSRLRCAHPPASGPGRAGDNGRSL